MKLADKIRILVTRLTGSLNSVTYSCGKCGLKVEVTDYPDRVAKILDIAIGHTCRPPAKTL